MVLLGFATCLLVLFIQSVTKEHLSIYEVTDTQIADDEVIRGIVIRNESVVKTKKNGFVNYYVGEGAKIGVNTVVYSIDETGQFAGDISAIESEDISLSEDDTREIRSDISNFRKNFDLSEYSSVTNFKYSIDNTLLKMTTEGLLKQLDKAINKKKNTVSLEFVKAKKSGIISFCSDGLEDLSIDSITKDNFKNMTDNWTQLRSMGSVEAGNVIYKLVNSERWSVVLPLADRQYKKIYDKTTVPVTFKKDGLKVVAEVSTFIIDSSYYAKLDFDKYMIRYLENRYLDIEIEFNNADGLKIPISSILKKQFYIIPKEYINKIDEDGNECVTVLKYRQDGTKKTVFKPIGAYYELGDKNVYIDASLFKAGNVIINKKETVKLEKTTKLEGVYNCNQGFCEFRRVEKLYSNDEYAIVSKNTKYGLSTYDHIVLNPDMISEDEIIY